jgi:hypothetical protein
MPFAKVEFAIDFGSFSVRGVWIVKSLVSFRQRQVEQMVGHFRSERLQVEETVELLRRERLEQEKKNKDQEQLIEELQRRVKMLEKKERAQEKQQKVFRYRVEKRYNTRSGKNWGFLRRIVGIRV